MTQAASQTTSTTKTSTTPLPHASQYHTPIMVKEIVEGLKIKPDHWYIDATAGGGGHTEAILQAGGRVVAIDQDQQALDQVQSRLSTYLQSGHLELVKANFAHLSQAVPSDHAYHGILLDLGVSSHQLDQADRGFSFESPNLDMRMDQDQPITATQLIQTLPTPDLTILIRDLGEERYASKFAKLIKDAVENNPDISAKELAQAIKQASPAPYQRGPIHPATRTFQALRLAVNAELPSLQEALPQIEEILQVGGHVAVLSFHSLEDRIVKHFFNNSTSLQAVTKKPIMADSDEVNRNPRSRSAKLRIAVKEVSHG